MVFSESGRAFFSERITGNIWEISDDKLVLFRHLPVVNVTGHHETGVIGIELDPNFSKNGFMYAYYTHGNTIEDAVNMVVRFREKNDKIDVLIDNIPAGMIHNSGIIKVGPDGKLYISVGVGNDVKDKAQDLDYLGGKILRINLDGSIPRDNPFKNSPVYSFGHRNMFGMSFHPHTGKLYLCEEGPETDDEINIIEPGGNYGWPVVAGYAYGKGDYIDPIHTYTPVITPTQSVFIDDTLYFGGYNDGLVHRLTLNEDGLLKSERTVFKGEPYGIIGVFHSPKDEFFIATTNMIKKVNLK